MFISLIENTLQSVVENGIDKKAVTAAVNRFEFSNREAGSGRYPRGLTAGLDCMETWLYDDKAAFDLFNMQPVYDFLRDSVDNGYFENIIKEDILLNNHKSFVKVLPKKGINKANEERLAKKLADYKQMLSAEDIDKLVKDTENLKKYQSEPSPAEDIEKIPVLRLEDIDKNARKFTYEKHDVNDYTVIQSDIFSNGISYISFNFDVTDLDIDDVRTLSLMTTLFKEVDTDNFGYNELSSEINMYTGGISFSANIRDLYKPGTYKITFSVSMKCLDTKINESMKLVEEILFRSHLDDKKKIQENLSESKSLGQTYFLETGHITSSTRALSYIFPYLAQNQFLLEVCFLNF